MPLNKDYWKIKNFNNVVLNCCVIIRGNLKYTPENNSLIEQKHVGWIFCIANKSYNLRLKYYSKYSSPNNYCSFFYADNQIIVSESDNGPTQIRKYNIQILSNNINKQD